MPVEPTSTTATEAPAPGAAPQAPAAATPAEPAPASVVESPLHDDPAIAEILKGLTPAQRETLLTTGGRNALEAHKAEAKTARAAAQTASDAAKAELAQQIGKAIGLVQGDEPADPAKLTEQLTAEKEQAQQARIQLAVFRNVGTVGDPTALLDSNSFLAKVKNLDPSDSAAFVAAIAEAVTKEPRLGAASLVRLPVPNPAQGRTGDAGPNLETQIAEATKKGDHVLAIRLKRQRHYASPDQ